MNKFLISFTLFLIFGFCASFHGNGGGERPSGDLAAKASAYASLYDSLHLDGR